MAARPNAREKRELKREGEAVRDAKERFTGSRFAWGAVVGLALSAASCNAERPVIGPSGSMPETLPLDPRPCEVNATRCSESGLLQRCSVQGVWAGGFRCPFVCAEGACTGECAPDERDCVLGTTPRHCAEDGTWQEEPTCPGVCLSGACVARCTAGMRTCSDSTPLACTDEGEFQAEEVCDFLCDPAHGTCAGECRPNALSCAGRDLQICGPQARWQPFVSCPYACAVATAVSGQAQCSGVCVPGDTRCDDAAHQATCNAASQWGPPTACVDQVCKGAPPRCSDCDGSQTLCNGQCVDVEEDPQHCGQCGHDCLGAACTGGVCEPATLAEGELTGLTSAPPYLYYVADAVYRMPLGGGTAERISSPGGPLPLILLADGPYLYGELFVDPFTGDLWRMPITGGGFTESDGGFLVGRSRRSAALQANAEYIVSLGVPLRSGDLAPLNRFSKTLDAQPQQPLLLTQSSTVQRYALQVDGSHAYIVLGSAVSPDGVSEVVSVAVDSGERGTVATADPGEVLEDIALVGGNLLFASTTRVGRVSAAGGAVITLSSGQAYRLVGDETAAYYFAPAAGGTPSAGADGCARGSELYRVPAFGGPAVHLATERLPGCIRHLVSDETSLYWLTNEGYSSDFEPPSSSSLRKASK